MEQERPQGIEPEPISDEERELFDLLNRGEVRGKAESLMEDLRIKKAPEILIGGNALNYSQKLEASRGLSVITGERDSFIVVLGDNNDVMPTGIITREDKTGKIYIGGWQVDELGFYASPTSEKKREVFEWLKESYLSGRGPIGRSEEEKRKILDKRNVFLDELDYILEEARKHKNKKSGNG